MDLSTHTPVTSTQPIKATAIARMVSVELNVTSVWSNGMVFQTVSLANATQWVHLNVVTTEHAVANLMLKDATVTRANQDIKVFQDAKV